MKRKKRMGYIIRLLLKSQSQLQEQGKKASGFTLIELLVALVVASIMISALLGFMVDILTTDRKEQARSNTEQEIQGAIDYIRRDLEQAVYIYDAEGLAAITGNYNKTECTSGPSSSYSPPGSCSQIPPASDDRVPVLAFWKRKFLPEDQRVTDDEIFVHCLVKLSGGGCNYQDYQVYSLVAYYLIKDDSDIWSGAARIGRFEIRDGIEDKDGTVLDEKRNEVDPVTGEEKEVKYDLQPSKGFMLFNLGVKGDNLREKMNRWQKHKDPYDLRKNEVEVLVDYIDQTTMDVNTDLCKKAIRVVTDKDAYVPQQVPDYDNDKFPADFKTGSFYACVDSERNVAQVYIRGNALARTLARGETEDYSDRQETFFPTTRIQVKGRGVINF